MTATIALPRQPHSDWLARLRTVSMGILRVGRHTVIPPLMQVRTFAPRAAVAGWWEVSGKTCVAVYQPKGAASYAASLVNLANPGTYDAAAGVAPTWAAGTGWTFDGTDDLLSNTVRLAYNYTVLVQLANWTGATCLSTSTDDWQVYPNGSYGTKISLLHGGTWNEKAPNLQTGNIGIVADDLYRDGALDQAGTSGWTGTSAGDFLIGRAGLMYGAGSLLALVIYSDTLTAGEVAAVSAAMAAL